MSLDGLIGTRINADNTIIVKKFQNLLKNRDEFKNLIVTF